MATVQHTAWTLPERQLHREGPSLGHRLAHPARRRESIPNQCCRSTTPRPQAVMPSTTPCGGDREHLLRPGLPHPAGTLALDQPVSARRPGGAAAGTPAKRRPWATVDLVAAGHGQPPHQRFPSGPMQATTRPRTPGPPRPTAPSRRPPHPATPGPARRGPRGGIAADSAGLSVRTPGHRTPGHRTPGHRTPGHWTLDVRSTGWTDVPRRDRGADRATTSLAGVRTSSRRRPPLAARPHPGHSAWGRLATQDGPAA